MHAEFTCCLLIYQQMVALYKDPNGEHVFDAIKESQDHWRQRTGHNTAETGKSDDTINVPWLSFKDTDAHEHKLYMLISFLSNIMHISHHSYAYHFCYYLTLTIFFLWIYSLQVWTQTLIPMESMSLMQSRNLKISGANELVTIQQRQAKVNVCNSSELLPTLQ